MRSIRPLLASAILLLPSAAASTPLQMIPESVSLPGGPVLPPVEIVFTAGDTLGPQGFAEVRYTIAVGMAHAERFRQVGFSFTRNGDEVAVVETFGSGLVSGTGQSVAEDDGGVVYSCSTTACVFDVGFRLDEVPDAGWVFHASASGLFANDVQYAPEPAGLAVTGALVAGLLLADPSGDRRRSRGRDR